VGAVRIPRRATWIAVAFLVVAVARLLWGNGVLS